MAEVTKIKLISSDKEEFEIDEDVAFQSKTIKVMIEDTGAADAVPLPNVSGKVLAKVIEYSKYHTAASVKVDDKPAKTEEEVKEWDKEFISVEMSSLFDYMLAANYLDIKSLLDLGVHSLADMIRGKTPDEIKTLFGIQGDFTPEEEEACKKEHPWAWD